MQELPWLPLWSRPQCRARKAAAGAVAPFPEVLPHVSSCARPMFTRSECEPSASRAHLDPRSSFSSGSFPTVGAADAHNARQSTATASAGLISASVLRTAARPTVTVTALA